MINETFGSSDENTHSSAKFEAMRKRFEKAFENEEFKVYMQFFEGLCYTGLISKLDLKVVCEGVETKEQNEFISGTECDLIQGRYYSKPMTVADCGCHFRMASGS